MNKGKKTVGIVITFFTRADQKSKMKSNRKKQIKDRKYIFDWAAVEWFPNEEVRPFNVNEEENTELWRKQLTRFDLVRDAAREGKGVDTEIKTLLKSALNYHSTLLFSSLVFMIHRSSQRKMKRKKR